VTVDLTPGGDQERSEEKVWMCPAGHPGVHVDFASATVDVAKAIKEAREEGRQAGREDAAEEKAAMLDALRRMRDFWYGRPGWTDAADTVDVLIDAFADGNQPRTPQGDVTP
jgi:hypothetical protein